MCCCLLGVAIFWESLSDSWGMRMNYWSQGGDSMASGSDYESRPTQPTQVLSDTSSSEGPRKNYGNAPAQMQSSRSRLAERRLRSGRRSHPRLQLLAAPSPVPSKFPTPAPSKIPSREPSPAPSKVPSPAPSPAPSKIPTPAPSKVPSLAPSPAPSKIPTPAPSAPTRCPTQAPTATPSQTPSQAPTPSQCPAGLFSPTGIWPCLLCAAGFYTATAGMTSCALCPAGALRCAGYHIFFVPVFFSSGHD